MLYICLHILKMRFWTLWLIEYDREFGDVKFSTLVDEAWDESSPEQMAVILRFVSSNAILTECCFAIESISNTTLLSLKNRIDVFVHVNLQVQNVRGQKYDGTNNMHGASNGLMYFFCRYYLYAYYVRCFAHPLQLTLVFATRYVLVINSFFHGCNRPRNRVNN